MSSAADRIRAARRARKLRLAPIATAAGVSAVHVSAMLSGRERVTPALAVAAEQLLGLDAVELIRLDNEQVLAKRIARVIALRNQDG